MASFDSPPSSEEPLNPYAPPLVEVGGGYVESDGDEPETEAIRRRFLGHEAAVKSIGSLHYLGAFFSLLGVLGLVLVVFVLNSRRDSALPLGIAGVAIYSVMAGLNYALGYGLRRLQSWARWTETVFLAIGTLSSLIAILGFFALGATGPAVAYAFGLLIYVYVLWLLLSAKGSMVFSPFYKSVIEKTPHIQYKTSLILKLAVACLIAVILLAAIGAVVGIMGSKP